MGVLFQGQKRSNEIIQFAVEYMNKARKCNTTPENFRDIATVETSLINCCLLIDPVCLNE